MKRIGNSLCASNEVQVLKIDKMIEIAGSSEILCKKLKNGFINTSVTIKNELGVSSLIGVVRKFPDIFKQFISLGIKELNFGDSSCISIKDCGKYISICSDDLEYARYINDSNKIITINGTECSSLFTNRFIDIIDYISKCDIPIKTFAIFPHMGYINYDLLENSNECYIGWHICDRNAVLSKYWGSTPIDGEYLMVMVVK